MKAFRRHWYSIGLVWAVVAIAWALLGSVPTVQMILLLNFAALMLHQFEEYGWPGGENGSGAIKIATAISFGEETKPVN